MIQINLDYQSENISDWSVFKLASDWFHNGFRLEQRISDCFFRFQICFKSASDSFQTGGLEKKSDWQSEEKNISDWYSLKNESFQTGEW